MEPEEKTSVSGHVDEARSERPVIVAIAVFLLAAVLAFRVYGELAILNSLYAASEKDVLYLVGWAAVPIGFGIFQVWLLWNVMRGKNWARIIIMLLVLFRVCIAAFLLASPFGPMFGSPYIAIAWVFVEVFAVVLLLVASDFFRPSQVGNEHP